MSSSTAILTEPAALAELGARLAGEPLLALDTEFMRERTYRAELCLVQIGTGREQCCVDPLATGPLQPLAGPLAAADTVKVLHAARQDLEVLRPSVGPVRNVFDTQIAAALAGFAAQIGYGELTQRVLGVTLPKAQTRTDWSRRPLSPEQIAYALDDVCYLLPLREALLERLDRLGRRAWLAEELAPLSETVAPEADPERAWLRLKGLQGLDRGRMALARALAAWRERRAIEKNRPRGWILDDVSLREIILRVPRDRTTLGAIPRMPEGVVRHCGDELLEIVAAAGIEDPPPPLPPRERPDPALMSLVKKLAATNQAVASELGISPEVLATRRDLEQLARGDPPPALRRGWRSEVIGKRLLAEI
jgi:ribonuclease D